MRRRGMYKKLCLVCGTPFIIRGGTNSVGGRGSYKRKKNSVTCSKVCSKLYNYRLTYNCSTDRIIKNRFS